MASPRRPASTETKPRSQDPVKVEELFARLRRDGPRWSRNRNFEIYQSPGALRTLRRFLWLRQLERDLVGCSRGQVRLRQPSDREGPFLLEIEIPVLHLRRRVQLSSSELLALREGPAAARLPADAL